MTSKLRRRCPPLELKEWVTRLLEPLMLLVKKGVISQARERAGGGGGGRFRFPAAAGFCAAAAFSFLFSFFFKKRLADSCAPATSNTVANNNSGHRCS